MELNRIKKAFVKLVLKHFEKELDYNFPIYKKCQKENNLFSIFALI